MRNIRMILSCSRDPGLVSDEITNIEKGIKWIQIIINVVLPIGWGIDVFWTRASSGSRVLESRYTKDKNNIGGPCPPSNNSFIILRASQ